MSNDQLLLQTKNLVQKERQINIQVLQYLQEIEKRKLYLKEVFPAFLSMLLKSWVIVKAQPIEESKP